MKLLFATLDLRLNNLVMDKLGVEQTPENVIELEYIEDVEEKAWESNPEYIFISDDIDSKNNSKNNGRIEPLIYQAIVALNDTFDVIYVTERKDSDPLIRKLLEKGFFRFSHKEDPLDIPGTLEQATRLLLRDIDIPSAPPTGGAVLDLPTRTTALTTTHYVDESRSIVTAIWSPIPNVGAGTFSRALAFTLAKQGRKVLLMELDWEYPKLSRTTALTHTDRNLKNLLRNISRLGKDVSIEDYVVNCKIAADDLPHTHKQAKLQLKKLPTNLFVLSREATARYEEEPELPDERSIDRLFFECKRAGFQHILLDLPSNPNNLYTMLSLLAADEKLAVVDESFATSGFFKMAMQAVEAIHISADDFELVVNKVRASLTAQEVSEFYDKTPSLALPYSDDVGIYQLELKMELGEDYMKHIKGFVKRYGIATDEIEKKEKPKFALFAPKGGLA